MRNGGTFYPADREVRGAGRRLCGSSRDVPADRCPRAPGQGYLRIAYFSPTGSRDDLTHDLLFERPRLDSASWFQNNVPGALLFVRAGGGRRSGLGDDPHVASALAAPSLGYAGGLLQCGVLWSGPNFHPDAALGFLMVSAGTPIAHARGMAGRGLVDAGARLSGACAVRLEWARMPVSVVCDGRMGRALRDRPP